jgi:outer membrane lipoprotein-sorting protein
MPKRKKGIRAKIAGLFNIELLNHKSLHIIITLIAVLPFNNLHADFLSILKQHEAQVQTLKADIEMTIKAQQKMSQKGKYYYKASDKLRFDFTEPVSQSMIIVGQKVYLKPVGQTKFIESASGDIQANLYSSDQFGYYFLSQYIYEEISSSNVIARSEATKQSPIIAYIGNEIINNVKTPKVKVIYDSAIGVVKEYNIIGNPIMPAINVRYKYEKIDGIILPVSIYTKVNFQMGDSISVINLKNIEVNGQIDDRLFVP